MAFSLCTVDRGEGNNGSKPDARHTSRSNGWTLGGYVHRPIETITRKSQEEFGDGISDGEVRIGTEVRTEVGSLGRSLSETRIPQGNMDRLS